MDDDFEDYTLDDDYDLDDDDFVEDDFETYNNNVYRELSELREENEKLRAELDKWVTLSQQQIVYDCSTQKLLDLIALKEHWQGDKNGSKQTI